jgi:MFS family permease
MPGSNADKPFISAADQLPFKVPDAIVVLTIGLAPAIGLALGRFAYALILPDMKASLAWNFTEAGLVNTANAAGYLAGAFIGAHLTNQLGAYRALIIGAFVCVGALALSAVSANLYWLFGMRVVTGIGAAFTFIAGGTLAAAIAKQSGQRAFLLALFYAGPGIGIICSAIAVPVVFQSFGPGAWPYAWISLSVVGSVFAALLILARSFSPRASTQEKRSVDLRPMRILLLSYLLYGGGYIAYMTFMIAWIRENGSTWTTQAVFWSLVGIGAVASPWLWPRLIAKLKQGQAVAALISVTLAGSLLPLLSTSNVVLLTSAFLFGSAFLAVVAASTAFVCRNLPEASWSSGVGALTTAFGLGQMIGPVATGFITDHFDTLEAGLGVSAVAMSISIVLALLQRDFQPAAEANLGWDLHKVP